VCLEKPAKPGKPAKSKQSKAESSASETPCRDAMKGTYDRVRIEVQNDVEESVAELAVLEGLDDEIAVAHELHDFYSRQLERAARMDDYIGEAKKAIEKHKIGAGCEVDDSKEPMPVRCLGERG